MIIGLLGQGSIGLVHTKNAIKLGHEVVFYDPAIPNSLADEAECISLADAVVISSPSINHSKHIEMCAEAGKPMLVEKPISTSMDDWTKDAIANSLVMVANNCRYHPVVKLAKEHIDRLGPPSEAWFRILQKNTKYTDPVILNWGAHEVDMALYLVDKDLRFDVGDVTQDMAIFSLKSKQSHVGIHLDYLSEPWVRDFALHWPDTSLYADVQNFKMEIFQTEAGEIVSREIIAVEGSHEDSYKAEMAEFIRRVEGKPSDGVGATGEDGLRCLKVLLEAQK